MARFSFALPALLAIAHQAGAAPTTTNMTARTTTNRQCIDLTLPIPVVATNHIFTQPRIDSTIDAIDWAMNITTWSTANATSRIVGEMPIDATFTISAQLCMPSPHGPKADILHIATHGLGFDRRYWDVALRPAEHSYLNAALAEGYSVLLYDRLGTGMSEKPDAYDVVQLQTESEVLGVLTEMARASRLPGVGASFSPSKIVQVGHSFGSEIIQSMLPKYGNGSDAAILTGYVPSTKLGSIDISRFNHDFPPEHDPLRFSEYGSGYFVITGVDDLQKLFFHKGSFEPDMLAYVEYIKQPETVGEYASETVGYGTPSPDFKGPIQFSTGEFDYVNCNGNCTGTLVPELAEIYFPCATNISMELLPNTGHALALSTGAMAGFDSIFSFLDSNGL